MSDWGQVIALATLAIGWWLFGPAPEWWHAAIAMGFYGLWILAKAIDDVKAEVRQLRMQLANDRRAARDRE